MLNGEYKKLDELILDCMTHFDSEAVAVSDLITRVMSVLDDRHPQEFGNATRNIVSNRISHLTLLHYLVEVPISVRLPHREPVAEK